MVTAGQAILPPGAAQPTADTRHARRDYYEQSASLSVTFSIRFLGVALLSPALRGLTG
jgi:hypothetical protein